MRSVLLQTTHTYDTRKVRTVRPARPTVPKAVEFTREDRVAALTPQERATLLMSGAIPSPEPGDAGSTGASAAKPEAPKPADNGGDSHAHMFTLKAIAHGCWYDIHLLAANGERAALEVLLSTYSKRFVCVKCRRHIRDYIAKHPRPSACFDKKEEAERLFKWTTDFHNAVTKRIYEDTKDPARRVLNDAGVPVLFRELTVGADEDEARYLSGEECGGTNAPCAGAAAAAPPVQPVRWVPP